jgi:hypothetical protein
MCIGTMLIWCAEYYLYVKFRPAGDRHLHALAGILPGTLTLGGEIPFFKSWPSDLDQMDQTKSLNELVRSNLMHPINLKSNSLKR